MRKMTWKAVVKGVVLGVLSTVVFHLAAIGEMNLFKQFVVGLLLDWDWGADRIYRSLHFSILAVAGFFVAGLGAILLFRRGVARARLLTIAFISVGVLAFCLPFFMVTFFDGYSEYLYFWYLVVTLLLSCVVWTQTISAKLSHQESNTL